MTSLAKIAEAARGVGLAVAGAFHPGPGDDAPEGVATLCLLGADRGRMWAAFAASGEMADGLPDPLDRWSARVIGGLADELGAVALFPFGGPPYRPFQRWAEKAEGALPSPVGMQVTARRGLWTSYRGALGFAGRLALPAPQAINPCSGCPAPCRTACPVDAFAGGVYDVPRCLAHITSPEGTRCRTGGCLVRHACPAGSEATPPQAQNAFHMEAFIRARLAAD